MLYLFHGSDVAKVRAKAFAWVEAARRKEPNLTYVRMAKEDISEAALDEVAQSGNLFAKRTLTLIDDPFAGARKGVGNEDKEEEGVSGSVIEEKLELLAGSENVIILLAPKLTAPKAKKFAAASKTVYTVDTPVSHAYSRGFNSGLVNALAFRKADTLWLEVVRALRTGDAPEMIHGLLHWKARDILEKGSKVWSAAEARELSLQLIRLLQESRRGGLPLPESLEQFALSI